MNHHTVDQSNTNLVSWPKSTLLTLRKHRAQAGERIPVLVLASVPLAIVVIFLLIIALVAFQVQDHLGIRTYGLGNFRQLYTDPFVYNSFINTAIVSAVSLGVAFGFGIPIAWLVERTNLPARGLVFPLFTINLLVPSFFTAMGWVILFHQRIGVVNKALMALLPIDESPLNIVSVVGMGVVEGFALAPLAFIMIAASFRALDPTLDECARVHGISFLTRLRKITIPLMKPSIMGAAIFVLAITVAAFDIPATIGLSNRIYTFSTFVYTTAFPPETPPNYGLVAASSSVMLIIGFFLTCRYMVVIGQSHRYAVVRGKDYRVDLIDLGRWSILGWSIIGLVLLLNMVLPLLALVWASLIPFLQVPSVSAFQMMSLDNFRLVPWSQFMTSLRNSVILFFSVPTITTFFGLAISWVVIRSKWRISHAFDVLAFLPHVIPNLILAVGAFLLVIHWVPTQFGLFERSIGIIILVYVVTRISFSTRMLNSGLLQIHEELDEAGYVAGLGPVEVIRKILIPLLSATLLYSWLWMALLTFRELTVAAFLASRENLTLPVTIWSIWNNGQLNQAAAAALVFVGLLTPLIILYFAFGRRRISMPQ